ncbi:MAG: iron-binding protein [Methylophilaceae bacterium]|nr:iron-binding protein [Methylophilaceae bacterium]
MSKEIVESGAAILEFDNKLCIHSRHCVLTRPDVFVPNAQGDWLHPECASAETLLHIAKNCPSGAIVVKRKDGGEQEAAPKVNTVRVLENGPLAFNADLTISRTDAEPVSHLRATLCRCGQSRNKPYCDLSHNAANFIATGEPPAQTSQPLMQRDGSLSVKPLANGPLVVQGHLEIISGTGQTLQRGEKLFLCRCGHSANKPYCDGRHSKVGFIAA